MRRKMTRPISLTYGAVVTESSAALTFVSHGNRALKVRYRYAGSDLGRNGKTCGVNGGKATWEKWKKSDLGEMEEK